MANTIQHKRSSTATTIPTSGQLAAGEIAINTADGKLYLKKDNASIRSFERHISHTGIARFLRLRYMKRSRLSRRVRI